MLINENRLNLMDAQAQKFLADQLELFLSGDDYERPQGWTPEK
jgi:Fe-S cluster biosynthesis and repair protein YggX